MMHNGIKVIDEEQLLRNIDEIKKVAGDKKICAMVKADGYGHGIETITDAIVKKVDFLGASNINEALLIREKHSEAKILIVGKTYSFEDCIRNDISFTIDSIEHFIELLECYHKLELDKNLMNEVSILNKCINIHIKIDSGMNRLGVREIKELEKIYTLARGNNINVEGISTHFATADSDKKFFRKQINTFLKFLGVIPQGETPIIHIGGSGVLIESNKEILEDLNFDMVRIGILMYGYNNERISSQIKPVLSVESKIIRISDVKAGEFLGYSKGYKAVSDIKVGIVPLGYGDGIPRNLSNKITVEVISGDERGKYRIYQCPVIANICMDMFFIDVTNVRGIKECDKVIIARNIKEWSKILQTIPYEILTGFSLLR